MNEWQCLMVTPSADVWYYSPSGKHQMAFLKATIEQNLQLVCGVRCVTSVRCLHSVTKCVGHSKLDA